MAERTTFDIIVIGAGPAGYCAAIRAAQLGLSPLVVEKDATPGGTCLNIGCIPSKALLDSSERFAAAKNDLMHHGIKVGSVSLDLKVMMERKESVVASMTKGIETLFLENRIEVRRGAARLIGDREVEIDSSGQKSTVRAGRAVIIASGSTPSPLSALPINGTTIVDSTGALSFDKVPGNLTVIGGGAIGVELASVWSRLGSRVTIVELTPQLLPGWDDQAARLLRRLLTKQGIAVMTGSSVAQTKFIDNIHHLSIRTPDTETELIADRILVAVGRKPYLDGLGLDAIGIGVDPKTGRIVVNDRYMTACGGVYAIGDCVPGPMLAHKAFDEGVAVAEIIAGKAGHVNYAAIPAVVYTSPEAACVGATEATLRQRGTSFSTGMFSFKANGRAVAMNSTDGFVKILADARTDAVLGVHIVGPGASELIGEAVAVMEFGGSSEDIARTMHAHPTLSEAVREAALDVDKRTLHAPPRFRNNARME